MTDKPNSSAGEQHAEGAYAQAPDTVTPPRTAGPAAQMDEQGRPMTYWGGLAGPDTPTPRTDLFFSTLQHMNPSALPDDEAPLHAFCGQLEVALAAKDQRIAELERNHVGEGTFICTCHSYPHAPNCGLDERLIALTEQLAEANAKLADLKDGIESANTRWLYDRKAREEAEGEVKKLNDWADGMSDRVINERQTAEAHMQELRDRNTQMHKNLEAAERLAEFGIRPDVHALTVSRAEAAETRAAQMFERTRERIAFNHEKKAAEYEGTSNHLLVSYELQWASVIRNLQPEPEQGREK